MLRFSYKGVKYNLNSSVSTQEKKIFLEWLLSKLEAEHCTWLLEEIIQDERKPEPIRFVDSLEGCTKDLSITSEQGIGGRCLSFNVSRKTRGVYTDFHEWH